MKKITGKYQDWTRGQEEALLNILGEENAKKLLSGEFTVEFKKAIRKLFDKNGRRIPMNLRASVCDSDKSFKLVQPSMKIVEDYANRLSLISKSLGVDFGITAEEFKSKTEEILSKIPSDSTNIKNGTWLPLILPKFDGGDIGAFLEKLLDGVDKSYKKTFGKKRNFYKYIGGDLTNHVESVCHTQDELIEKMKKKPVVVVFFPNALQGFSIDAAREQIGSLPAGFVQSGIETIVAMIMYADILARDYHTPNLLLSAFSWASSEYSLRFSAMNNELHFGSTDSLADASDPDSAGLSFHG